MKRGYSESGSELQGLYLRLDFGLCTQLVEQMLLYNVIVHPSGTAHSHPSLSVPPPVKTDRITEAARTSSTDICREVAAVSWEFLAMLFMCFPLLHEQ